MFVYIVHKEVVLDKLELIMPSIEISSKPWFRSDKMIVSA